MRRPLLLLVLVCLPLQGWEGFNLHNPGNQLEAHFASGSVTAEHPGGHLQLRLEALGYGEHPPTPLKPVMHTFGNRVEYRRGTLTEWYVNDARGIEQGFTLQQPPPNADGGPLYIDLAVHGDLQPVLAGDHIELCRHGHAPLEYTGLRAWDADGRGLSSVMSVHDGQIRLAVDDRGAAYPITVDPWLQQQELTAADLANHAQFGVTVAISGDTAVVGAVQSVTMPGAAYVYVRSGNTWSLQQELTAPDGAVNDQFGNSVAISGNTILIGAPYKNNNKGVAYVFTRSGINWTMQQELTPSDPATLDTFGIGVALSGNIAIISAPYKNSGYGAVYAFVQSGGSWTQQAEITPPTSGGYSLGQAVAVNGTTAVMSAAATNSSQGAAYVYVQSGSTWNLQQQLSASDGKASDSFGQGLAISGDTVAIGARISGVGGAVYVFTRSGSVWTFQQKLIPSDTTRNAAFGIGIGLSGDLLVAGADGANNLNGVAYVFQRSGSTWTQLQELTASDGQPNDFFGAAVALDSGTAVIGAYHKSSGLGGAYVFVGGASTYVTNVSSTTPNGTYFAGASVNVTVTFNAPVIVTGAPQIALNSGGTASYLTGSGTSSLTFTYLVSAGQSSSHLDGTSSGALTLNGGTIDASDGVTPASLILPSPGASGSLGANANIVIASVNGTTTTLASSLNPSIFTQNVTLTANVFPAAATGIVTFMDGATKLGTAIVIGGVASIGVTTIGLGSNSLTAVYGGDALNLSSTSAPLLDSTSIWGKVGVFRNNQAFLLDSNGNGLYDAGVDRYLPSFTGPGGFMTGDLPVTGDWTGDGHTKAGIYRASTGTWYLDANNNGVYDAGDVTYSFGGLAGDMPVAGDWMGLGKSCIGIYRSNGSFWLLDLNCNGVFENTPTDAFFPFGGLSGDVPVVGAWTGGKTRVGVVRKYAPGGIPVGDPFYWVPDAGAANAGNAPANHPADIPNCFAFGGLPGDVFVDGDWYNTGVSTAGVYRAGFWVLDAALPGAPQTAHVAGAAFGYGGAAGDIPVTGKW